MVFPVDFKNPAISYLIERADLPLTQLKLDGEKPREFTPQESSVLDLGALPPIGEMVNDRRWHAALLNNVFESGGKLIFVCKAEGLSLIRLSKFISDFPILLRKIPIYYLLNLAGNSREERAMEKKFLKLVAGEKCMVVSQDHRMANLSKSGNKVIGKLVDLVQ